MNQVIILDFNRTLFDPESNSLIEGAQDLLQNLKNKGFTLILLAQAAPSRADLIKTLDINQYFSEIRLVDTKSKRIFKELANKHQADLSRSYVIGDRAHQELRFGHQAGWQTIWVKQGKFSNESPTKYKYRPTHTIKHLSNIDPLLKN